MPVPLLATKLYIPTTRETFVARQRLFEQLDRSLTRKLLLVSAPAGFGKTSLLSAWIEQGQLPAAWLTCDQSDNDPARFLIYIVGAMGYIIPDFGEAFIDTLQSPQTPSGDLNQPTLVAIINEINSSASGDFLLVLDDYHLITSSAAQNITAFLLENMPPKMHLIIASRADPYLPLPLLRGRDELVEIRQIHLSFKPAEAAAFAERMQLQPISNQN